VLPAEKVGLGRRRPANRSGAREESLVQLGWSTATPFRVPAPQIKVEPERSQTPTNRDCYCIRRSGGSSRVPHRACLGCGHFGGVHGVNRGGHCVRHITSCLRSSGFARLGATAFRWLQYCTWRWQWPANSLSRSVDVDKMELGASKEGLGRPTVTWLLHLTNRKLGRGTRNISYKSRPASAAR